MNAKTDKQYDFPQNLLKNFQCVCFMILVVGKKKKQTNMNECKNKHE